VEFSPHQATERAAGSAKLKVHMKRHLAAICFIVTALITLVGCGGPVKYPSYYTLHLPPPPDPPPLENVDANLAVREFRSPVYLRQGAIVYKSSPEQIGFYNYHRWAIDPREFVTNAITEHLRASGKFSQVKIYDGRPDANYVLSGRLEELEEIDYEGGVKVHVAISAQMVKVVTGAVVWSNSVSEVGIVSQHQVPAVVSAMNQTMGRAIDKLLDPGPVPVSSEATNSTIGSLQTGRR
jgi:ABC-type uncharacterized transport system auxiliary subunit